jgi:hypothetical protein
MPQAPVLLRRDRAARPCSHAAGDHADQDRGEGQHRQGRPQEPHSLTIPIHAAAPAPAAHADNLLARAEAHSQHSYKRLGHGRRNFTGSSGPNALSASDSTVRQASMKDSSAARFVQVHQESTYSDGDLAVPGTRRRRGRLDSDVLLSLDEGLCSDSEMAVVDPGAASGSRRGAGRWAVRSRAYVQRWI